MKKLLSAILLMVIAGCSCDNREEIGRSIIASDSVLCVGDVVFRTGSGLTSHAVLMADPKGEYSHVGIVVDSCGELMIVHAVPGEPDYSGDPDRVKMDTPQRFFSREFASAGEVCRFQDSAVAHKAARIAVEVYHRRVLFDDAYNLDDTTKMYCTELVLYAFSRAGHPIENVGVHEYNLPLMPEEAVLPIDIYNTGEFLSIYKFNSKNN